MSQKASIGTAGGTETDITFDTTPDNGPAVESVHTNDSNMSGW